MGIKAPLPVPLPGGSAVKNPMQESRVRSLGQEDPLEKETVTHSGTLARRIPWTEEPGGLQSTGRTELDTTEAREHRSILLAVQLEKWKHLSTAHPVR